jgi:DNA-binding FadR family transcriptional regulator
MQTKSAKYKIVRNALEASIRRGDFHTGERLPSERQLAAQFGVSHMTARHAVTDLVESELLERRPQSGIYVRPQTREKLSRLTLKPHLLAGRLFHNAFFFASGRAGSCAARLAHTHHSPASRLRASPRSRRARGEPSLVF